MNWKLIALDLDGTLLDANQAVSEENKTWIRKAQSRGIQTTIATGRMKREMVDELIEELGIVAPVVTTNGSEVWTSQGELLERHLLSSPDVGLLLDAAQRYRLNIWACPTEGDPVHDDTFPQAYERLDWLKFGFYGTSPQAVAQLWAELTSLGRFEVTNSDPLNIEVNPYGINKATGLARVCSELGITSQQVVAVGDSFNDIAMLQWAGLGIAMGNAQDEVKAVAGYVTEDRIRHGVARAIEYLLD